MSDCQEKLSILATVSDIAFDKAFIVINNSGEQNKVCAQCQKKGGCQSLSISSLFLKNKLLSVVNQGFKLGDVLEINFPSSLIFQSIFWLIGLPFLAFMLGVIALSNINELLGFIAGILAMVASYVIANKRMTAWLNSKLSFHKIIKASEN